MKKLLLALAGLAVAFVAVTWWALEAGGVAVLETRMADGGTRATHVWFVAEGDGLWIEAGAPENGWVRDVGRDPRLTVTIDGRTRAYRAGAAEGGETHATLRGRLRAKYGWRDRWVGLLVDASRSQAVRMTPDDGGR